MKMTKAKTLTAKAVEVPFASVSDIALQHGQAVSKTTACAEYGIMLIKNKNDAFKNLISTQTHILNWCFIFTKLPQLHQSVK